MRIAIVNTLDTGGGAAWFARRIGELLARRGHEVAMLVGRKHSDLPWVYEVPVPLEHTVVERALRGLVRLSARSPAGESLVRQQTRRALHALEWRSFARKWRGDEDFELGGTARMLERLPFRPDILNLHNLHTFLGGTHLDLRALPDLSRSARLVFTMQDPWLTSGHCAHSFECERWRTTCGSCPNLRSFPAIRRDRTAENLARKRAIYASMRYSVVGCCRWIVDRARASALAAGMERAEVIHNGIDLDFFSPAPDRELARKAAGLAVDERAVCFISDLGRASEFRDYGFVESLAHAYTARPGSRPLVVFEVGGQPGERRSGRLRFVGPGSLPRDRVRDLVRACDALVHPARADTYPTVVLEAMACGVPVLASAVGGIPEQIDDGRDGFLHARGDLDAAVGRLGSLLDDVALRERLGTAARARASATFGEDRMADAYEAMFTRLATAAPTISS
jgi:glycosyltransferase involved in cell wall biosynthesis